MLPLPGSRYAKRALMLDLQKDSKTKKISASPGRLRAVTKAKRAGPATPLRRMPAIQQLGYPRLTTLQPPARGSGARNPLPERPQAVFRLRFRGSGKGPDRGI